MLLRPPFVQQQDVKSQSSNGINPMEREKSVKSTSKNKKKQNTLGMRKTNMIGMQYNYHPTTNTQTNNNYDSDHGSVHSVNSRRSKGKTKESTIAIGKKQPQNIIQNSGFSSKDQLPKQQYEIFKLDSDEENDNKSIGSHASRNSKKNTVKESSLGKNRKVNVQLNYYNQKDHDPSPSPIRNYMEEESKVQVVKLNENVEPFTQPLKYNEALKGAPLAKNPESRRRTQQVVQRQISKPTSSPFEQITLKRQEEQDEPVYRLKEPEENVGKKYQMGNNLFGENITQNVNKNLRKQENPFGQRNNNNAFEQNNKSPINFEHEQKKDLQQSNAIQPQMISTKSVTKSRRNKIFDNDGNSISNSSNIMNSGAYLQGSFEGGRSKSKSKLGELLKESRDKKQEITHKKEKEIVTIKPQQVVNVMKPIPQQNPNQNFGYNFTPIIQNQSFQPNKNNIKPLQRPNTYSANQQNESIRPGGQKMVENHLKHEPIQRKTIENQVFDLGESQTQLNLSVSHKIPNQSTIKADSVYFNFEPEKKKGLSITSKDKPSNKSLESKKHLDRLMKKCQQNEQFLAKSILSSNSELRQSNKPFMGAINSPNNLGKKEEILTRPFERIKEEKIQEQPAWHQMVKNDGAFQIKSVERREIRRTTLEERQTIPSESNKPISPAEFFRMENQMNPMKSVSPKQEQINQPRVQAQPKNEIRIQQQQKNKLLTQISKKPRDESKQQLPNLTYQPSAPNPLTAPIYDRQSDEQINLNFSDAYDGKLKQIKNGTQKEYVKDHVQTSALSHELSLSENGSERSNSQSTKKQQRKKQSSLNIMKKHKVQVREQDPRADESFYDEPPKQKPQQQYREQVEAPIIEHEENFRLELSNTKVEYKKPNLIDFQQGDIEEEKIKSKTDMNFYNYGDGSQRSIRVPSSKPPLSRKSGCSSSKSKSKAKESTLNINPVKKETKINKISYNQQPSQQQKKKKTLLEIAQDKEYEGSGYGGSDSQCSFNSRESFGSMNSKGSRRSQSSKKQSTLPITIKSKATTMNQFRPSLTKINSADSQVETFSNDNQSIYNRLHEQSMRNTSRQRQVPQQQERTIVSKDTYFIDERGRLVKQDLIIKGNQIYGQQSANRSAEQMAFQRMKRSRQHHRSRSKSREGRRSRMNKQSSSSSMEQNAYDSSSSSNFFNSNNYLNSSNYNNPQFMAQKPNLYIEQFIKPIQQPYKSRQQLNYKFQKPTSSNQRKMEHQFYQNNEAQYYESYQQNEEESDEEPVRNVTLNELFGRGQKTSKNNYDQRPNNNSYAYQQPQQSYNNYNQKRQQYGNNSRFNGQDSTMKQSQRKKSLSRTEKTFYNR